MTRKQVESAMSEADRFMTKAREALKHWHCSPGYDYGDGKFNGALKRASLDLTRALADMRKVQ